MSVELTTDAEQNAKRAETLLAFSGLNILHIKRSVASLLGQIGRGMIFDQYTKHDISHIDRMLQLLDWIIPASSKQSMTDADWLMIVLAVYFHDMGMLVTNDEFKARATAGSGFETFCQERLFAGQHGPDYKAKVATLPSDEMERFLYQEFVRAKHAERIKSWILGQTKDQLGVARTATEEVSSLLEPIDRLFRRDLGIVCESHHLNDLGDLKKYRVSQPYGSTPAETVNLQYSAVLLRTADLLHVTSDRTPSIEFRTINPSDPVSQQEWAKQLAVKSIRAKWGLDEDGKPDETASRDTVEVHAFFTREDGFFGLTSYLAYAAEELKRSNEWISQTLKQRLAKHEFPWRRIDDTNVETEGFIRYAFEFTIDQAKILDLLTGHTLYNNTNVVLRELVQNAIDAIRLKNFPRSSATIGRIAIVWNSRTRILSVQDNGTGMTQDIINNFLLKVGSSRYKDPDFLKENPGFSSISRFGIGVLSTFMISDSVEIVSCHPDEEDARRLLLRSVHGKYLIRLLDKGSGDPQKIGPHGTIFRLQIRPSVELADVLQTAQHWIVVPDCIVTVQVDDGEPQRVGYSSPSDALRGFLSSSGFDYYEDGSDNHKSTSTRIRVVERTKDDLTLAYALWWNRWFQEWSFLGTNRLPNRGNEGSPLPLGTCVEGVRIVTDTPGFEGYSIVAIANARGPSAPKTNVARSGLEANPELTAMLRSLYSMYAQHVVTELDALCQERSFSLTWATGETIYLLAPLLGVNSTVSVPLSRKLFQEALQTIPCVLVEEDGKRRARSPDELSKIKEFWTIDCDILSSAEAFMRQIATTSSIFDLVNALNASDFRFPSAPVVCGMRYDDQLLESLLKAKEVDNIIVRTEQRRVDLHWVDKSSPARWISIPEKFQDLIQFLCQDTDRYMARSRRLIPTVLPQVPTDKVFASVPSDEIAVTANGATFLLPGSEITAFVRHLMEDLQDKQSPELAFAAVVILIMIRDQLATGEETMEANAVYKAIRAFDRHVEHFVESGQLGKLVNITDFTSVMTRTRWRSYDLSVWRRRQTF